MLIRLQGIQLKLSTIYRLNIKKEEKKLSKVLSNAYAIKSITYKINM